MPKAYSIAEFDIIDAAAQAELAPLMMKAQSAAGGRPLGTAAGKVTSRTGSAPQRVAITEWDSAAKADAFRETAEYKKLEPLMAKALKMARLYVIEVN